MTTSSRSARTTICSTSGTSRTGRPRKAASSRSSLRSSGAPSRRRREGAMIKRFHVLYVGQIELDNIGLNGTPANDRRYSDERLREVFATVKDVAQHMDALDFDVLWTAEHHFQREGYEVFPN